MTTTTELTPLLKRLKLGAVLNTLPERVALARREQLDYASFLQIILTDEINRRDHRRLELRLQRAGFEQTYRLEDFDWSASITLDRRLLDAVFSSSSSTATSTSCSSDRSAWARASSLRSSDMLPSGPGYRPLHTYVRISPSLPTAHGLPRPAPADRRRCCSALLRGREVHCGWPQLRAQRGPCICTEVFVARDGPDRDRWRQRAKRSHLE